MTSFLCWTFIHVDVLLISPRLSLHPVTLQMLYKIKTSKVFDKPKPGDGRSADLVEEDPFAVQMVSWCPHSRIFCVVGISAHIILYRFSKHDANTQIVVSDVIS